MVLFSLVSLEIAGLAILLPNVVQLLVEVLQSSLTLLLDVVHGLHVPVLGLR